MSIRVPASLRRRARTGLDDLAFAVHLRSLPPRIALLQLRARGTARRIDDRFSLGSTTRPGDLATLLRLARGRRQIVELGTGTAWTTIALAAVEPRCHVWSYDPVPQSHRDVYLAQAPSDVRARIALIDAPGSSGPRDDLLVDLLYIDSSHEKAGTLAEVGAWMPFLAAGAVVVFDDYTHAIDRGVAEAIHELGLPGEVSGTFYVHRR